MRDAKEIFEQDSTYDKGIIKEAVVNLLHGLSYKYEEDDTTEMGKFICLSATFPDKWKNSIQLTPINRLPKPVAQFLLGKAEKPVGLEISIDLPLTLNIEDLIPGIKSEDLFTALDEEDNTE